ncbi:MAG TPA: hypothetical protein VFP10_11455 [Candidatus Eisenbacteria bacterium]|nr:hypothetical protein [Candidatus Eisenbacteria bacterium]
MASSSPAQETSPETTAVFHQDLAWSPDGSSIVFSANDGHGYDLWIATIANGQTRSLTKDGKGNLWADWSPDGKTIAFSSGRDGGKDIYLMDPDGTNVRRLTEGVGRNQAPSWSPDQSWLAFMSDRSGTWQIFVMRADGKDAHQVTRDTTMAHNPVWSRQNSRIVFYDGLGQGKDQIGYIGPDGKHLTRLSKDAFNNVYPAWSPDGESIVFASNREGSNKLFTMRADGSQVRKVSDDLAFFARWAPKGNTLAAIFGKYPRTAIGILSLDNPEPKWITPKPNEN